MHARSSVSGGARNMAQNVDTSVFGGVLNKAVGKFASVSGGRSNFANGETSTISGGTGNKAENKFSSISDGMKNQALGVSTSILGGKGNVANKSFSMVSRKGNKSKRISKSFVDGNNSTLAAVINTTAASGDSN